MYRYIIEVKIDKSLLTASFLFDVLLRIITRTVDIV